MVLVVSFISPPSLSTSFSPYSFPLTDNKTTRGSSSAHAVGNLGVATLTLQKCIPPGRNLGQTESTWIHTKDPAQREGEGVAQPLKIWAPAPHSSKGPWCGWHPAASLVPSLARRVPGVSPATWSWGAAQISTAGPETTPVVSPLTPFTSTLVIMQPLLTLLSIPFILASVPVRPSRQG